VVIGKQADRHQLLPFPIIVIHDRHCSLTGPPLMALHNALGAGCGELMPQDLTTQALQASFPLPIGTME